MMRRNHSSTALLQDKKALLLDMNGTFMFGEDRFGPDQDYFAFYQTLNGGLCRAFVNAAITNTYNYLDARYVSPAYRERFPSVADALVEVLDGRIPPAEIERLVMTFAHHECGEIPLSHVDALHALSTRFILGAVIDIWAPKRRWLEEFDDAGINGYFSAVSFSSDCAWVKPSPRPFVAVLTSLGCDPDDTIYIGDSVRRDLGGALNAGLDCVLVGGAYDSRALVHFASLVDLTNELGLTDISTDAFTAA